LIELEPVPTLGPSRSIWTFALGRPISTNDLSDSSRPLARAAWSRPSIEANSSQPSFWGTTSRPSTRTNPSKSSAFLDHRHRSRPSVLARSSRPSPDSTLFSLWPYLTCLNIWLVLIFGPRQPISTLNLIEPLSIFCSKQTLSTFDLKWLDSIHNPN